MKKPAVFRSVLALVLCLAMVLSFVPYQAWAAECEHDYAAVAYDANCLHPAYTLYTCADCGDSYKTYPEDQYTAWQEEKPDVDESLIQTKLQYRTSDYKTFTSYETEVDGYEQVSSRWVETDSGSVTYVHNWAAGFDTTSEVYAQYNNKKKVVGETETTKTVVESDKRIGYLWYHWCDSSTVYSWAYETDPYHTFHTYYGTVAPSNYVCDPYDNSYLTSHTSCSNTDYWFPMDVYQQDYTTYANEFTYAGWSEFSEWSDTVATATETRKVETRTVYRYVDVNAGAHAYSVITSQPTCKAAGSKVYTCSVCGDSYTEKLPMLGHAYTAGKCTLCGDAEPNYYLVGYINGADYGCESDYENMGDYKFVDGKVTVSITEDSYVFIKTEGNDRWYMTQEYVEGQEAVFCNTETGASQKMFVPGDMDITFTLTYRSDDTILLTYVGSKCIHKYAEEVTAPATCTEDGSRSGYFLRIFVDTAMRMCCLQPDMTMSVEAAITAALSRRITYLPFTTCSAISTATTMPANPTLKTGVSSGLRRASCW